MSVEERMLKKAEESTVPVFSDTWRPTEEGEYIFGTITDIRSADTKYGKGQTIAEIEQLDGEIMSVWITHHILKKLWDEQQPDVGDNILILYKGPELSDKGKVRYYKYGLSVEKLPTEVHEVPKVTVPEVPKAPVPVPEVKPKETPTEFKWLDENPLALEIKKAKGVDNVWLIEQIAAKRNELSGMITPEGALMLLAKECGVEVKPVKAPEKKPEEKPKKEPKKKPEAPKPEEKKIVGDKMAEIKKFVVDMMGFYAEMADDELKKLLDMRKYSVEIPEIISLCNLKRTKDNKLALG